MCDPISLFAMLIGMFLMSTLGVTLSIFGVAHSVTTVANSGEEVKKRRKRKNN